MTDLPDDRIDTAIEDLEELIDDYVYKVEELEKSCANLDRARCYLELVDIRSRLLEVTQQLEPDDIESSLWQYAQHILSQDSDSYYHEALRLLVEACQQLNILLSHISGSMPPERVGPRQAGDD